MTKREVIITAVCSFVTGVLVGIIFSGRNGKVVVNGDHNVVHSGYKSNNCNHNGNHSANPSFKKKNVKNK